jgi:hypothetical protein
MIDKNILKKAEELSREALKNCQNFIKLFKIGSRYHLQIEKAIEELNSTIEKIEIKSGKKSVENVKTTQLKQEADSNASTQSSIKSNTNVSNLESTIRSINTENSDNNVKYFKTKILSDEVRENATKIAESQMNFDDFPRTSYGFEKAFNSMKKRDEVFFSYLTYIGAKSLLNFYINNELSYQVLIGILQCLKKFCLNSKENATLAVDYLFNIPKTKNFHLIKKFLKKVDKEDLKETIKGLNSQFVEIVENIDLEKLYF